MNALPVEGKGAYIWKPANTGSPQFIANEPEKAKVDFVTIKLHNGMYFYPDLAPTIDAIRERSIAVGGWGYIYLKYNALREAETAVRAIRAYKPSST